MGRNDLPTVISFGGWVAINGAKIATMAIKDTITNPIVANLFLSNFRNNVFLFLVSLTTA